MQIITVEELKEKLDASEHIKLLDVREPDENIAFNIGGVLLPLGDILSMQIDDIEAWRNEEVVCYCRSGNRSMQAALMLETFGFTNVKNLAGGMNAWQEKYPK